MDTKKALDEAIAEAKGRVIDCILASRDVYEELFAADLLTQVERDPHIFVERAKYQGIDLFCYEFIREPFVVVYKLPEFQGGPVTTGPIKFTNDAPGFYISHEDCGALAKVLERVLETAQMDPLEVLPLRHILRSLQESVL